MNAPPLAVPLVAALVLLAVAATVLVTRDPDAPLLLGARAERERDYFAQHALDTLDPAYRARIVQELRKAR